ncbi:MAG: bifunctional [glutamate--ammonia ligase]-adenylyl-L-tyrosine phosphorylase/[glutamate--ammonia-ligase] adenylyltransferase [Chthoniobacterales bacterium]
MSDVPDWIRKRAADTLDPSKVEMTLASLAKGWSAQAEPLEMLIDAASLGQNALLHLISVSSICATRLVQQPDLLSWLAQPQVSSAPRHYGEMLTDLRRFADEKVAAENFRLLRVWKGREMFRIALREVSDAAPLEETAAELSHVAEICVAEVVRHWSVELGRRRGIPSAKFAVLALGKLGGRELNHSSDIDLMFLYSEEGHLAGGFTYHQWFNLLGEKIVETFATPDASGSLFRVDLRLRPEGTAGPLARSLESMENYYSGFGETWERLALTKARGICGNRELTYDFLRQHQPFIYPKSPTSDLLDEVATIKRRIERDVVGHENIDRDVKLGAGGIREVEFVVQALQLLHGARHAFLQDTSTLKVLSKLLELDLLTRDEARALDAGYRFLRRVEHRLQIEGEQQTHTLPNEPNALCRLALSLGFHGASDFSAALKEHQQHVREVFHRIVSEPAGATGARAVNLTIFRDEKNAAKALAALAQGPGAFHIAPRTRQVFRNLRPLLLQSLGEVADPDATLNQFVRFVEAYGLRSMLFELLVANPRLLELLIKTFDASRYAGDLLIRRPQLLEESTPAGMLDRDVSVAEHLRRLNAIKIHKSSLDALRVYRHTQSLRILLRDVLALADLPTILREQTALAEACLLFVNRLRGSEDNLTIIALGKFGGSEISYGADLDVIFIGEDIGAAQRLMVAMAQSTAEGAIFTLDPRLRPDGEKGPLACSLASLESYYRTRAHLWEIQALTRARPITGPDQDGFLKIAKEVWQHAGQRPDLCAQIHSMLERIRRDRGTGSDIRDFKTGVGGIVEAEFLVQGVQMRAGCWSASMHEAIERLAGHNLLTKSEAGGLTESYAFLRRVESALRRFDNKSVSNVPAGELEQRQLAARMGLANPDVFVDRYRNARETIHAAYARHVLANIN